MIVGCLGDISFAVFDSHVETIKNMVQMYLPDILPTSAPDARP